MVIGITFIKVDQEDIVCVLTMESNWSLKGYFFYLYKDKIYV